jgi:hypothetical protein
MEYLRDLVQKRIIMLTYIWNMGACGPHVALYSPLHSPALCLHPALFTLRTRFPSGEPEEPIDLYCLNDARGA